MNLTLTPDLPRQVGEHIGEFRGRGWLLQTLADWFDRGDERMFLLTGDPGTGKSMLLAWLLGLGPLPAGSGQQALLIRLREAVRAAHFCQASSRNVAPHAFAHAVANQLTQNVAGFADALAETLADRVSIVGTARAGTAEEGSRLTGVSIGRLELGSLSDELSFDRAFSVPLKRLYERGEVEPVLLLVDALDEAQTYGGTTLSELLSRSTDLPSNVRIIASTRDDPRVLRFFRDVRPFDLKRGAIGRADDVREYVHERIGELEISKQRRFEFGNRLADRADGVFLYASMVLDDLAARPQVTDLSTYALPEKLGGLYHGFLTRELGKNDRLWFDTYEPLFGLIAVAQGDGLTSAQLTALAGRDLRAALRASKQYLAGELPDGPFRLFHKSFADFLVEPDVANPDYRVEPRVWHNRIADYCLQALAATAGAAVTDAAANSVIGDYGLNNLCTHLAAAGRTPELIGLIDEPWMRLRHGRAGGTYGPFQADVDVAWREATRLREQTAIDWLVHLRAAAFVVQEQVALYKDDDLRILVSLGRAAEALAHARLRATPKERFDSLHVVIRELGHGQPLPAVLVADTRQAAAMISDTPERVSSLRYLVGTLTASDPSLVAGILEDMKEAVETLEDGEQQARAQRSLVEAFGSAGRLDEAEQLAITIDDGVQCAFALQSIAVYVAKSGRFAHALAIARRIDKQSAAFSESAIRRIASETLSEIALAQAIAKDADAGSTFRAAEKAAKDIDKEYDRDDALYDLGDALVQSGDLAEATRIAASITGWHGDRLRVDLVESHAARGEFSKARSLLLDFENAIWTPHALHGLAIQFATAGRYEEAIAAQSELATEADQIRALLRIAAALQDRGDSRGRQLLTEAAWRAKALEGEARADAFAHLTRVHLAAADMAAASETFRSKHSEAAAARDRRHYCTALRGVAGALSAARHPQAGTAIAAARRACNELDSRLRESESHELAKAFADMGRFEDAWSVLGYDLQSAAAWSHLALRLDAHGNRERAVAAIKQALNVVLRIPNETARDEDLVELSAPLEAMGLLDALEDAAERIKGTVRRCQVLTRVAVRRHAAEPARSRELFERAERDARADWSDYSSSEALVHIVEGLSECRYFDEARRVAGTIATGSHRFRAICAFARHLTKAGASEGQSLLEEGVRIATSAIDDETMDRWWTAGEGRREAARLDCENNPGAAAKWNEASTLAGTQWADWSWQNPQYRAEALVEIAAAVGTESERDRVFVLAHTAAKLIEHDNPRSQTLLQLVRQMIASGRRDLAGQALADLHREHERRSSISELTKAHLNAGDPDAGLRVAQLETSEYYRRELTGAVAIALAGTGRMRDALQAIDEQTLDGFIGSIAAAHSAWRTAPPGAIESSLRALMRVAAWVRSDWRDLGHALFGSPTSRPE